MPVLIGPSLKLFEPFLTLPGLALLVNPAATDGTLVGDASGLGHTLAISGTPAFGRTPVGGPYIDKTGTAYLSAADAAWCSVTGPLFIAGYAQHDNAAGGAPEAYVGKWLAAGNQRSYELYRAPTTGYLTFSVTVDGATTVACAALAAVGQGWTFVAGRYIPGAALACWINGVKYEQTSGVPAALFDGAADLQIGNYNGTSGGVVGNLGLFGLWRRAPADAEVLDLFNATRWAYGV